MPQIQYVLQTLHGLACSWDPSQSKFRADVLPIIPEATNREPFGPISTTSPALASSKISFNHISYRSVTTLCKSTCPIAQRNGVR
jgi:hypothetical protein